MKTVITTILFATILIVFGVSDSLGQKKAPDYKIAQIKILPFDSQTGAFQEELQPGDDRSFFNDLSISLLVLVEIQGEAGSFEVGRRIQVSILEGTRVKASRDQQIGLIGDGGRWFEAIWLTPAMCSDVKISAKILGQRTQSASTRSVPFNCGE